MSSNLAITNVINISVATSQTGVGNYNTSNLALFTDEAPQQAVQTITFSDVAASGAFVLTFGGNATVSVAWNAALATIQSDINAVTGMASVVVAGSIASKTLTLTQPGTLGAILVGTATTNTLENAGSAAITLSFAQTNTGWSGGAAGYSSYLSPTQIGLDFGTTSISYQMAVAPFSQQPNILAAGGEFTVIPFNVCQQTITLSATAASGAFVITYNSIASASIAWNATPATIQTDMQAIAGLGAVQVTGSIPGRLLTFIFFGVYGASVGALTVSTNTLETAGSASITATVATSVTGESMSTAITRTQTLVPYFGIMCNHSLVEIGQTDLLAAAATVQSLNCLAFWVSYTAADIAQGGMLDLLRSGGFTQSRGLYYGATGAGQWLAAVQYMAAYAGRGLSTNFTGSNTTQTMHLKPLSTILPDPTLTQAQLVLAVAAGADTYVNILTVACIFTSGTNNYFDQVYNLQWLVGALQVAGFNYLAQSGTKIPQTEQGMDGLKTAYRVICEQAVTNQYFAPGTWTNSTTFGVQQDFLNNILQRGYYIYSTPIAQQSQATRSARQAPLVQIAGKQAGAIQSSTVIVNINA